MNEEQARNRAAELLMEPGVMKATAEPIDPADPSSGYTVTVERSSPDGRVSGDRTHGNR